MLGPHTRLDSVEPWGAWHSPSRHSVEPSTMSNLPCGSDVMHRISKLVGAENEIVPSFSLADPADYVTDTQVFSIPAGQVAGSTVCYNITIQEDNVFEPDERFRLSLTSQVIPLCTPGNEGFVTISDTTSEWVARCTGSSCRVAPLKSGNLNCLKYSFCQIETGHKLVGASLRTQALNLY